MKTGESQRSRGPIIFTMLLGILLGLGAFTFGYGKGGNHSLPPSKLEQDPWLKRLFAGYAFCIDYREARGHAFILSDQEITKRVTDVQQAGACLHGHASITPTYRRIGLEKLRQAVIAESMGQSFNQ